MEFVLLTFLSLFTWLFMAAAWATVTIVAGLALPAAYVLGRVAGSIVGRIEPWLDRKGIRHDPEVAGCATLVALVGLFVASRS